MGSSLQTVTLPGQVWGLAAPGPSGPLVATTYDGDNLSGTVLTALEPSGAVVWPCGDGNLRACLCHCCD